MRVDSPSSTSVVDPRLVTIADPRSFEADQFRRLRQRIEERAEGRSIRSIAVTSAVAGDGKTIVAVNLAASLARGARVLLVDADLRRPKVGATLGLSPDKGDLVAAVRSAATTVAPFVRRAQGSALDVLATDAPLDDPYEFLTSRAFTALMAHAREAYEMVIVDTAPILPVPDTGLLKRVIDGYVMVISANSTPRKLVGEALNTLDPSSVLGLVFNRDADPMFGYYGGYKSYFQDPAPARRSA
jgi:capsular exopolysaccharide synthesis family protein